MKIVEYNDIDPLQALVLSRLALNFSLTPEVAASMRQSDPRPFPCLAIYAQEGGAVLGQAGILRLSMVSTHGQEDVGCVWAVAMHPQYAGRGVASMLLEHAHERMLQAGLRFSTLGTDRYRATYQLLRRLGYEDTKIWATAFAPWDIAHQPTRLRAEPPGPGGYELIEKLFRELGQDYLGFALSHTPISRLRLASLADVWILRENARLVGYVIAHPEQGILNISNILLAPGVDLAEAIAAIVAHVKTGYVQVKLSRPSEITSLRHAGYQVAHPSYDAFMIKPLIPDVTVDDARKLFGIGTDRFLISWVDFP